MAKSNFNGDMSDEQAEDVRQKFYIGDVNAREAILEELNMNGHTTLSEELEAYLEESDLDYHEEGPENEDILRREETNL